MLTCPQKLLASALLLGKGFLGGNTVAHKFLYCVNGSAWVVSNPVPGHIYGWSKIIRNASTKRTEVAPP